MPVSITLPATATYAERNALWNRVTHDGYPVCGVLEIREAVKPGRKVRVRRYAVQEQARSETVQQRRFKLTKPMGTVKENEDKEHYVCLRMTAEGYDLCQCKGYAKSGKCAHTDTLRALLTQGQLPAPTSPVNGTVAAKPR